MTNRRRRGNVMVEFAVSFSLLFAVLAGVYQFGYSLFLYNKIQTGVRAGARYASLRTYDSATGAPSEAFLTAVRNTVIYGNPAGGTRPAAPGLVPENIRVTVTMFRSTPEAVTIDVDNYRLNAVFGSYDLRGRPALTVPYVGRFAPR